MIDAYIALGGNLGDVRETFDRAIAQLCDGAAVTLTARSSDYRTPPWGVTDQPPFVNAVIAVTTWLAPHDSACPRPSLRARFRTRPVPRIRYRGPRTLDIDSLIYDEIGIDDAVLTLPHPKMLERGVRPHAVADLAPELAIAGVRLARRCNASTSPASKSWRNARLSPRHSLAWSGCWPAQRAAWQFAAMSDLEVRPWWGIWRVIWRQALAAEFTAASRDDWRKLVDAVLKGAPFGRLESRTRWPGDRAADARASGAMPSPEGGGCAMDHHAACRSSRPS